jgi:hypothetical protein
VNSATTSPSLPLIPQTPAERAAWARLRAAQVAFPDDPDLAARLIQQAADDLREAS